MTQSDSAEYQLDLARQVGALEGQLSATRERLAALEAELAERVVELDQARATAASAESDLSHYQRRAHEREDVAQRHIDDLEARLAEADRLRRTAEEERHAVIAALGRRARRHLGSPGEHS